MVARLDTSMAQHGGSELAPVKMKPHVAPFPTDGSGSLRRLCADRSRYLGGLMIVLVAGLGRLMVMSGAATRSAADESTALFLAVQKIEQLRGLTWTYDRDGREVSDFTTRLAVDPPGVDGLGLRLSPP